MSEFIHAYVLQWWNIDLVLPFIILLISINLLTSRGGGLASAFIGLYTGGLALAYIFCSVVVKAVVLILTSLA